jgi:hypothetical protein
MMRVPTRAIWVVYLLLLVVLATANAAGYRYGVADQAFYIPSIMDDVQPQLFPRDTELLRAQDTLMVSDELLAGAVKLGAPLPWLMLAGYVASLLVLFSAALSLGRQYNAHAWTTAAFCAALTLRHRITKTGANSFEGYFHPRVAAFACGAAAVAAVARDRLPLAWALTLLANVLHPTTGVWWAVWLGVTCWVVRPAWRRMLSVGAVSGALVAFWMLARGPLAGRLAVMDERWTRVLASKDYVFPDEWTLVPWLVNLLSVAIVAGVWRLRVARGVARPWEAGAAAGVLALVAIFLASMPFIDARVALAVQLQTSRVFWLVDFLAVAAITWLVAEAWLAAGPRAAMRPAITCALVLAVAAGRGTYILVVERPGRDLVQATLEANAWQDVGAWAVRTTPTDAHLLVDPDHDWKFGHSLRIMAQRDVLVEGVKDTAVAMYSREIALRVDERVTAIGDFATLTPDRARALARRYDLDYLVIDRRLPMPEAYRNSQFYVYRLQ